MMPFPFLMWLLIRPTEEKGEAMRGVGQSRWIGGSLAVDKEGQIERHLQLVLMLVRTNREHSLEALMKAVAKAEVVILDELGYVPLNIEGVRLSF